MYFKNRFIVENCKPTGICWLSTNVVITVSVIYDIYLYGKIYVGVLDTTQNSVITLKQISVAQVVFIGIII